MAQEPDENQEIPDDASAQIIEPQQTVEEFRDAGTQKVQLDVDDAPFLGALDQDIPDEIGGSKASKSTQEEEKPKSKKKLFIIIGAALLIIIGAAAFLLFSGGDTDEEEEEILTTVVVVPTPPKFEHQQEFQTKLEPFWIPLNNPHDKTKFLVATFILNTRNTELHDEIKSNINEIRDSIFFYFTTKNYAFLTDSANTHQIKSDLLTAINQELVRSKLDEIFLDSFLIK